MCSVNVCEHTSAALSARMNTYVREIKSELACASFGLQRMYDSLCTFDRTGISPRLPQVLLQIYLMLQTFNIHSTVRLAV